MSLMLPWGTSCFTWKYLETVSTKVTQVIRQQPQKMCVAFCEGKFESVTQV